MKGRKILPAYKRLKDYKILKEINNGLNYGRSIAKKMGIVYGGEILYNLDRLKNEGFIINDQKEFTLKDNEGNEFKFNTENNPYNIKYYKLTEKGKELLSYFEEVNRLQEKYKPLCQYCEERKLKLCHKKM